MSNFGKKYDPNKRLRNKILNETKNSLGPRKQRKTNTAPIKKYKKQKPNIFSYIVLLFLVLFFIFKK